MLHRLRTTLLLPLLLAHTAFVGSVAAQTGLFEVEASDETKLLRLHDDAGFVVTGTFEAGTIPASGQGVRLMWYPGKAAFRVGRAGGVEWDDAYVGTGSMALGLSTMASGNGSTALGTSSAASGTGSIAIGNFARSEGAVSVAMGRLTVASGTNATASGHGSLASGEYSFAAGDRTVAEGQGSTAMGTETRAAGAHSTALNAKTEASGPSSLATGAGTVASADNSTAMGLGTKATGDNSTAMGQGTTAAGVASVAMGTGIVASGDGSFAFGDRNTSFPNTALTNEFRVRAFGGVVFNTGVNIGCVLPKNDGTWACTSSRLAKEGFEPVDGEEVLSKLAALPVERWRYRGSEAEHIGPTAEDFHAAFGLGDSTTRIATVDADGVALRAIQALEQRTAALRADLAALRAENDSLRARLTAVEERAPGF